MWVLSHIKTGRRFYLLTDSKKYTVGRGAQSDLSIPDDVSVSRDHAFIYRSTSGVRVEDSASKYGVFVNSDIDTNTAIPKKTTIELHIGDIVRFGRGENTFRLENIEIKVCTSTLSQEDIEKLTKQLKTIDGVLMKNWSTECTHLVMQSVTVTVKVLQSLAYGVPIVSPAFWDAYIQAARKHATELPNVDDFVPDITEPYVIKEPSMMTVHLDRQRLFQNKTFVFMVKHQMDRFQPIITLAAGKCVAMDKERLRKSVLCKPEYIPVQYTPLADTQSSLDVEDIAKHLVLNGRRMISESEIGLALVHRSIDRFCNPDRKIVSDFQPNSANHLNTKDLLNNILMDGTPPQENIDDQPAPSNSIRIPESDDLTGTEPNNNADLGKASPRKSTRLSSKSGSTNLPDQHMPPPPVPPQQSPSTSKQTRKRKHAEQTSPPKSIENEPMQQDQEQTSAPTKKQKPNDNDSGENSSGSASGGNPTPASASQQNDFNFSGFISTQKRPNRTRVAATSQASPIPPSRLLEKAKENRKRAVDMLNANSDDEKNDDDDDNDDGKAFNFNRQAKRAKVMSKQQSQAKSGRSGRSILDDDDDDDDDGAGFSFNFSRKRQTQAKRKHAEDEMNDVCVVDASSEPSQNTYKKPFQHVMNRSLNRTIKPIEFIPAQKCETDWITRKMKNELNLNEMVQSSDSVKIKDEKLEESEMTDEQKKQKWIKSMAKIFKIREIDVNLSRSRCAADETDSASASNVLNNTKNFKKFVKKNNYIPHTTVIKTHPVPVMVSVYAR